MKKDNFTLNSGLNVKLMTATLVIMASLMGIGRRANAAELQIIDVRRNIPLSDDEAPVKDFYIAGVDVNSLKKDQVITLERKMAFKDSTGTQNIGEISIPVGQLKVIFIGGNIAVARQYKIFSRNELPMVEQQGLMIGDLVDLTDKGNYK